MNDQPATQLVSTSEGDVIHIDAARAIRDWLLASSDDAIAEYLDWQQRGERLEVALLGVVNALADCDGAIDVDATLDGIVHALAR